MGNIVIVGAGKEGKGFAGDEFEKAGWKVTFIDRDAEVVEAMKDGYTITNYRVEGTFTRRVENYDIFLTDKAYACMPAVVEADVIALCIYPEDMQEAAEYLAPCLAQRHKTHPDKKLDILSLTNKNHYMDTIESGFVGALESDELKAWWTNNVALRDCIVRRGCNASSPKATEVTAATTLPLLIQQPIYSDLSGVEWMQLEDGIEELKDVKLFTYNSPHATTAYAGYAKGFDEINAANKDPEIAKLKDDVLEECVQGVLKSGQFSITEEQLRRFLDKPVRKERDPELISRVAIDPIRKLARGDRLVGPAVLCYESGIMPKAIVKAVAYGMAYDEPSDPAAMQIQAWIADDGIVKAVSKVIGLPEGHELTQAVANEYANIKK